MAAATPAARIAEERVIEPQELPFEFCLNALRLVDGFDSESFEERTALPRSVIDSACGEARERGLLEQKGQCWAPTALGRRFLNDLQAMFLPSQRT
jgi:oxygen-independent coproporphyrinogen-3 oxidase